MRIKHVVIASIAGVLAASALAGIAQASSHPGLAARAIAYDKVKISPSHTDLSGYGMTNVTVISMFVPAGSWVVSAKGDFVNFGPSDYTRCTILANNDQISGGITAMVGNPNLPDAWGPGAYVQAFSDIGTVTSAIAINLTLQCSHDHYTPSGYALPYVDAGVTLWAHPRQ